MLKFSLKKRAKTLVVVALLIFLHFVGALRPLENFIIKNGQPLLSYFYNWGSSWRQAKEEAKEDNPLARIEELDRRVAELTVASAKLKELEQENQELREYLNFFQADNTSHLLAQVVYQENFLDSSRYGQNILINQGAKQGVKEGQAVVNSQGIIIGKVMEAEDNSAKVCFITNSSCKLAVKILNQEKTIGVTEGQLGLTAKINFVGQTEKISLGDIVVTSGLEKDIPAGLVVGRVSEINNSDNDVWQNISLEPLVNFNKLGILSVVLSN